MKHTKLFATYLIVLASSLSICTNVQAQVVSYKANQVIKLGNGESLQVIKCSGEVGEQQCELRHLVNNKQVGKPFWLKSASIAARNTPPKAPTTVFINKPAPLKKSELKATAVENNNTVAKNDAANLQAEMLSMAKMLAQNAVPPQQLNNNVPKETIQESAPKKAKKEFVSMNPYLQKKTQ